MRIDICTSSDGKNFTAGTGGDEDEFVSPCSSNLNASSREYTDYNGALWRTTDDMSVRRKFSRQIVEESALLGTLHTATKHTTD